MIPFSVLIMIFPFTSGSMVKMLLVSSAQLSVWNCLKVFLPGL